MANNSKQGKPTRQGSGSGVVVDLLADGADRYIYNTCLEYAEQFRNIYGFESIEKITQTQFNACLEYIYHEYIKREYDLRVDDHMYNAYDIQKLKVLYTVYQGICSMYDKATTLHGYCFMCGIDYYTISCFITDGQYGGRKATPESVDFFKRVSRGQELSFRDKLTTGKQNPVGIITLLNHDYGYATQTVRHEITATKQDLQAIASAVGVALEGK